MGVCYIMIIAPHMIRTFPIGLDVKSPGSANRDVEGGERWIELDFTAHQLDPEPIVNDDSCFSVETGAVYVHKGMSLPTSTPSRNAAHPLRLADFRRHLGHWLQKELDTEDLVDL